VRPCYVLLYVLSVSVSRANVHKILINKGYLFGRGGADPEIRQRGYVYQKGRKKSDRWVATERAYGYFRVDVPGKAKQKEVRIALGLHRDRFSAMLKLREEMQRAGVLDLEKIRERISPSSTWRSEAARMLAEMAAGRIVNKKTRKPIRQRTIEFYRTAANYLNTIIGDQHLSALDNPEAKSLVQSMKAELNEKGNKRFEAKTIAEYFKVFAMVIASAKDERTRKPLYPRAWDLAEIGVPQVCANDQHRPTIEAEELETFISRLKRPVYVVAACLLAGTGMRISEMLALELKHISPDCGVITIEQQRGRKGTLEPPKTQAGYRRIHVASSLAQLLKSYIGDRKSGYLFPTETAKMNSKENLWRDGFETVARDLSLDVSFHSFRRLREAVLQMSDVRQLVIDYWMGHENPDMSTRYGKQLRRNSKFLAEQAEKVGLGFDLNCDTCDTNRAREVA
jgi:integrase